MLEEGIAHLGRKTTQGISALGQFSTFAFKGLRASVYPLVQAELLLKQFEFVGNKSFTIIVLAAIMVGGIFGFQLGEIFRIFGATSLIGAAAGYSLARELAPVVTAFLVTGRAGSAMAAEIATMRVNEQIDAMRVMSVDPFSYLIAPRIIASAFMMPLLTMFFILVGVISAFLVALGFFEVDVAEFFAKIQWIVKPSDIFQGLQKAFAFGLVFSTVGCYQGFYAKGGAKGVGQATTVAVVSSYILILLSDYLITYLQFRFA